MTNPNDKLRTMLGFAQRAGKLIFGTDNILSYRKKIHLVLYDKSLSPNAVKKLQVIEEERNLNLYTAPQPLEELVG
ncbi:MAG: hypothetical protein FWC82_04230, partial [Firmicutes bacterium]|nr:hypothetical protein [Bacillota bacterium]